MKEVMIVSILIHALPTLRLETLIALDLFALWANILLVVHNSMKSSTFILNLKSTNLYDSCHLEALHSGGRIHDGTKKPDAMAGFSCLSLTRRNDRMGE